MAATSSFTLVSGSSASGGATSPGEQKGWLVPWYEYHGTMVLTLTVHLRVRAQYCTVRVGICTHEPPVQAALTNLESH